MKKLSDLIGLRTIKTAAAIIIALAIVNQYGVANRQVSSETFIRYRNHFAVADNRFISGESKGLTSFQRQSRG